MPDTYHPTVLLSAAALTGRKVQVPCRSRKAAEQFLQTARNHGVTSLLQHCVQEGTLLGLSDEDQDALSRATRTQIVHDLVLNNDTRKTLDLLAEAAIPALLLKGTPVAFRYYKDTYLRIRCDTDLFIPFADTDKAAEVLASNGYRITGLGQRTKASKQFGAVSAQGGAALGASFDVHWKLSNRVLFSNILEFEECWKTRQPLSALGSNAYTLSPAHLLLHACIHRIAHGRNTERNRLLWLYDIHLITSTFSQEAFDGLLQLAIEKQVGALCRDALLMSQYYFSTRYPRRFLTDLARNQRHERTAGLIKAPKLRWVLADLTALKTTHERLAFAGELLFPEDLTQEPGLFRRMRSWTAHLRSRIG